MWYTHTHTHNGILLSPNKVWYLSICDNIDGPREYYAKWSKSDTWKTNTVPSHLHVESKKQNKQRQQNRNRLTDTENKLMVAREERGEVMSEIGEGD